MIWVGLLAFGMTALAYYSNKPGVQGPVLEKFPLEDSIRLPGNKSTMLVFLHPYCSCSQATLDNLARLQPVIKDKVEIYALFFSPSSEKEDWNRTLAWHKAARIPGVHVMRDTDGRMAKQFHVATSGHVIVYGVDEREVFSGGITPARGHGGDSKGSEAIRRLLESRTGKTEPVQTFVFGCSILNSSQGVGG